METLSPALPIYLCAVANILATTCALLAHWRVSRLERRVRELETDWGKELGRTAVAAIKESGRDWT